MRIRIRVIISLIVLSVVFIPILARADSRLEGLKKEVVNEIQAKAELTQQMVDMIFSFAELGFQEHETSRYLTSSTKVMN